MTNPAVTITLDENSNDIKELLRLNVEPHCYRIFENNEFNGNYFLAEYHMWTAEHVVEDTEDVIGLDFTTTDMRDIAKSKTKNLSRGIPIASTQKRKDVVYICTRKSNNDFKIIPAKIFYVDKTRMGLTTTTGELIEEGMSGSPIINSRMEALGVLTNYIGVENNGLFTPFSQIKFER